MRSASGLSNTMSGGHGTGSAHLLMDCCQVAAVRIADPIIERELPCVERVKVVSLFPWPAREGTQHQGSGHAVTGDGRRWSYEPPSTRRV